MCASNIDIVNICNNGDQCFELTGTGGAFDAGTTIKGCMPPTQSCAIYTETGAAVGVTVTECKVTPSLTGGRRMAVPLPSPSRRIVTSNSTDSSGSNGTVPAEPRSRRRLLQDANATDVSVSMASKDDELTTRRQQQQVVSCRNFCLLSEALCIAFGYEGQVDEVTQCGAIGDRCFELTGTEGAFSAGVGPGKTVMGCMAAAESCEQYTSAGASLGVTITECKNLDPVGGSWTGVGGEIEGLGLEC